MPDPSYLSAEATYSTKDRPPCDARSGIVFAFTSDIVMFLMTIEKSFDMRMMQGAEDSLTHI